MPDDNDDSSKTTDQPYRAAGRRDGKCLILSRRYLLFVLHRDRSYSTDRIRIRQGACNTPVAPPRAGAAETPSDFSHTEARQPTNGAVDRHAPRKTNSGAKDSHGTRSMHDAIGYNPPPHRRTQTQLARETSHIRLHVIADAPASTVSRPANLEACSSSSRKREPHSILGSGQREVGRARFALGSLVSSWTATTVHRKTRLRISRPRTRPLRTVAVPRLPRA